MRALFLLLFGLAAIVLMIRHIESRSIFFPMKGKPSLIEESLPHEDVFLEASDGVKLHGWFVPLEGSSATVLFLHGNAGNIGHRWEKLRILHEMGVSVFILDYRGYGLSEGRPSEKGMHMDATAAYDYILKTGISAGRIVVYGESIGGAFAVDLAARRPVGGLIVEDSFTSIPAMVRRSIPYIPAFTLATRLDSLSKISKVSAPKLIFHSEDDEIIPFEMGEALFGAAKEPKRFVRLRGGHNTAFLDDQAAYERGLREFLGSL